MSKIIKISVIGAGAMAYEHLKVFSANKNVKIMGIHSRTKSKSVKLSNSFKIPIVCDSIQELYYKTKSNLVIICVNETSTKKIIYQCFKFPWIIFSEKPVGYNFKIAKEIYKRSLQTNSKVYVGMNRRHYSSSINLLKLIKNDKSKKIISIIDQQDISYAKKFNTPNIILKNFMFANSIHVIDYLNFVIKSEVKQIKNIITNNHFISALIIFKNNDVGNYICYWNRPGPWSVTLSTGNLYCRLSPIENLEYRNKKSYIFHKVPNSKIDHKFKPGFYEQSKELLKAAKGKKSKIVTLKDFIITMDITKKIYK